MKTFYTLILSLFLSSAFAQNEVVLDFTHLLGDQPFALNTAYPQSNGNDFIFNRCEFYISEISITHDGGMETLIEDTWLLVKPAEQASFSLGQHDINEVESISWSIGVSPDVNNEDPTLWPADHPLAPQNPSMHWGWTSGYRFIAIEGLAGENLNQVWEVHALGNNNYFSDEIATGSTMLNDEVHIGITGAYENFIFSLFIDNGVIAHGESGNTINRVFDNVIDRIFTASDGTPVSIEKVKISHMNIHPNPTNDELNIVTQTTIDQVEIYTAMGKKMLVDQDQFSNQQVDVSFLTPGTYMIRVKDRNHWHTSRFIKL